MGTILEAKDTVVGKVPALMEQVFFCFFLLEKDRQ